MNMHDFVICERGRDVYFWRDFLERGQEISGNSLTDEQEYRLIEMFIKTHRDEDFRRKLVGGSVTLMLEEAKSLPRGQREEALGDIADACLTRAGFPNLISRSLKKIMSPKVNVFMIQTGRTCFSELHMESEAKGKKATSAMYESYICGFVQMVEVLWVATENHPHLLEIFETSKLPGSSYSKRFFEQSNSFVIHGTTTRQ